jgi:hypothetical protein
MFGARRRPGAADGCASNGELSVFGHQLIEASEVLRVPRIDECADDGFVRLG